MVAFLALRFKPSQPPSSMASSSKKARVASAPDARMRLEAACRAAAGASSCALRKVIEALGEERPSREALQAARTRKFRSLATTLHVETKDGTGWDWTLCHPNLLLSQMVNESPSLQQIFSDALRARPCSKESPWNLVIGYDEFVPGNKLQVQASRKAMNLQFSFLELGKS